MIKTTIKIAIVILLVILGFILGVHASKAEAPDVLLQDKPVSEIIIHFANQYGQDSNLLIAVAKCESGLRSDAVGDGGRARNIYQFHEPTFDRFAKELGEELNYNSAYDQAKLASFAFSKGESYRKAWTCYKKAI